MNIYEGFHICGIGVYAVNVVAILHNFWEQKQRAQSDDSSAGSEMESLLLYESASSPGPPYVCYVTLPGGSCFGNYKVSVSTSFL